jgi:uncharacterized protein (TIGR03437 family)
MRKLPICLLLYTASLLAQTADIAYFRAVMLPSNEVPAVPANVKGMADMIAHVVRDSSGQIVSGTVDFLIRTNFDVDKTATGLHIHTGGPTDAGPVVINTGLSASVTQAVKAGADIVHRPAQVDGTNAAALNALRGIFTNPAGYYVNIHTTDFPGGIMRGQLQPAIGTVLMGLMSSDNEVPPQTPAASGTAVVVALATFDSKGALATGVTYQSATYKITDSVNFTGFHIHPGTAGNNGPASLSTGIPSTTLLDPSGSGIIGPYYTEVDLTNAVQVSTFLTLFQNPSADYINVHTNAHGGGAMRAQLRPTDSMTFPITMDSANETAATKLTGTAPSRITVRTLRNEDGSIAAGTVFFDVNYRMAGAASFTGLHIHDAGKGVNGAISIPMVPTYDANFSSDTGFGNYFNWTPGLLNVATLSDVVTNPENHYANIHTTLDPSGTARAQLAPIVSTAPAVTSAFTAAGDNKVLVAPGGLISIYGTNLAKVATDLSGWAGRVLPSALNGTSVTIGGKNAPLLYVGPGQINAQVPVDVPAGQQAVVVKSVVGAGTSFNVTVAATAPAIFFSAAGAAVLKNVDFSVVSAANPAKAGDVILVYCTGLGATSASLATGTVVPSTTTANTSVPVTATIGGKPATVTYAMASPGFAGLYQVALTVPAGVTGSSPIVLTQGTVNSNSASISVQ